MFRFTTVVATSLTSLVAVAAPRLKTDPPGLYFPATVGDKWKVILVSPIVPEQENVGTVKGVETAGGVTTVTIEDLSSAGRLSTYVVEASDRGVCVVKREEKKLDPPEWILKLPPKPGTRWEAPMFEGKERRPGRTEYRTIMGEEEVETPAGKFKAIRVDVRHREDGDVYQTEWHAVGWGRVRIQMGKSAIVLKSFTHGK